MESPTVTFSPLRDEEFTRRLVASVDLDSLYLLTRYGRSLERTLRLLADEVNDIRNAPFAETPKPLDDMERMLPTSNADD